MVGSSTVLLAGVAGAAGLAGATGATGAAGAAGTAGPAGATGAADAASPAWAANACRFGVAPDENAVAKLDNMFINEMAKAPESNCGFGGGGTRKASLFSSFAIFL